MGMPNVVEQSSRTGRPLNSSLGLECKTLGLIELIEASVMDRNAMPSHLGPIHECTLTKREQSFSHELPTEKIGTRETNSPHLSQLPVHFAPVHLAKLLVTGLPK
jgi:hypothetical protein